MGDINFIWLIGSLDNRRGRSHKTPGWPPLWLRAHPLLHNPIRGSLCSALHTHSWGALHCHRAGDASSLQVLSAEQRPLARNLPQHDQSLPCTLWLLGSEVTDSVAAHGALCSSAFCSCSYMPVAAGLEQALCTAVGIIQQQGGLPHGQGLVLIIFLLAILCSVFAEPLCYLNEIHGGQERDSDHAVVWIVGFCTVSIC